ARPPLVGEQPGPTRQVAVGRDGQTTVAGGDVLGLLQAETAEVTDRAGQVAGRGTGQVRLRAVLDQDDAVLVGQLAQLLDRCRLPVQVHGDDRAGELGDLAAHRLRVQHAGAG